MADIVICHAMYDCIVPLIQVSFTFKVIEMTERTALSLVDCYKRKENLY